MTDELCPLCRRPVPPSERSRHHLVPKTFKGRETVILHRICHRKIHSVLTEREILRDYATIDALRAHPDIARFVDWVRDKPPGYYDRTRTARRLRDRR